MPKLYPILIHLKKSKFSPKTISCRQPITIEHEKTLNPRQPIRIEYHSAEKTQTLSARVVDPSRLSAPVEPSLFAIAYLNTWRVDHPSTWSAHNLTTNLIIFCYLFIANHLVTWDFSLTSAALIICYVMIFQTAVFRFQEKRMPQISSPDHLCSKLDCSQAKQCVQSSGTWLFGSNFCNWPPHALSTTIAYLNVLFYSSQDLVHLWSNSFTPAWRQFFLRKSRLISLSNLIIVYEMIPAVRKTIRCLRQTFWTFSHINLRPEKQKLTLQVAQLLLKDVRPKVQKKKNLQCRLPNTVNLVKRSIGFLQFFFEIFRYLGQTLLST